MKTPTFANWLVSRFIKDKLHEEFLGDLEEIYQDRMSSRGKGYAILLYWVDVMHLLIGFSSLSRFTNNSTIMYKHYFTVARRNLWQTKFYSLINLLSLAVGMGVCLMILQYIYFELSYDRFHTNHENTYRVIVEETDGEVNKTYPKIGYAFGIDAKEEIPEIEQFVRKEPFNRGPIVTNLVNNAVFHEEVNDLLFVDPSFFQMFHFPLKQGNQQSLFDDPFSLVITEETAKKYFGADDPLGKTLTISGPPSPGDYTVTGVLEDLPLNSHLQFDFLMPMANYLEFGWGGAVKEQGGWNGFSVVTYLTLRASANPEVVAEKLNQLIARHQVGRDEGIKKVILQPIADIYMKSGSYSWAGFLTTTGNMRNIQLFSAISLFILLIAYINYINLSTARSMYRAKEVGVRKSVGAYRNQLVSQFIIESVLVNVVSAALALGIAYLLLPMLNHIIGKELTLSMLQTPIFWLWFLIIVLLGSLLSGLYPAFVLSAFNPIRMLRGNKTSRTGNFNLRRGLIVFQFLASLLLISATFLVYKQTTFMKNQELGINLEKILVLKTIQVNLEDAIGKSRLQAFKNEITQHHSITSVAGSRYVPGEFGVNPYRKLGEPESATPHSRSFFADLDFSKTYGLEFIAGGPFTESMNTEEVVLMNEAAVKAFGFVSPEKAIQERLSIGNRVITIVGVVKNFHWHSLKESHTPYVIELKDDVLNPYLSIKMNLSDISGTLNYIEKTYRSYFPTYPFEYFFADDAFNRQYQAEVQFGNLFFAFAALAIFISCIGLFALVSFSTTMRIKEIGIRKVLGANTGHLMMLLSREYLSLISIAIVIAVPAILYWGSDWLEKYAYRIALGWDLFVIPASIMILISMITVSYQTYSAARTNPVKSLKTE